MTPIFTSWAGRVVGKVNKENMATIAKRNRTLFIVEPPFFLTPLHFTHFLFESNNFFVCFEGGIPIGLAASEMGSAGLSRAFERRFYRIGIKNLWMFDSWRVEIV